MSVIYEPRGRALEYSPLAASLYSGCTHGCRYCYVPAILRITHQQFSDDPKPRASILNRLEADCRKMAGDPREVMFSFMSDPYQPAEMELGLTRRALDILRSYDMRSKILTKGGLRPMRDLDVMKRCDTNYGVTLTSLDDADRLKWEPGAASPEERIEGLERAHAAGIRTWVSLEPVYDPDQSLAVLRAIKGFVDHVKIGTINHAPAVSGKIDWPGFLRAVKEEVGDRSHYIKADLERAGGGQGHE